MPLAFASHTTAGAEILAGSDNPLVEMAREIAGGQHLVVAIENREVGFAQVGTDVGDDLLDTRGIAGLIGGRQMSLGDAQHL